MSEIMNLSQKTVLLSLICVSGTTWTYEKWKTPNPLLRIDQISMLGAHDALIAKDDNWIYAQQQWNLERLLDKGVRALEFDLATQSGKDDLFVCHGSCESVTNKVQKIGKFTTLNSKYVKSY